MKNGSPFWHGDIGSSVLGPWRILCHRKLLQHKWNQRDDLKAAQFISIQLNPMTESCDTMVKRAAFLAPSDCLGRKEHLLHSPSCGLWSSSTIHRWFRASSGIFWADVPSFFRPRRHWLTGSWIPISKCPTEWYKCLGWVQGSRFWHDTCGGCGIDFLVISAIQWHIR